MSISIDDQRKEYLSSPCETSLCPSSAVTVHERALRRRQCDYSMTSQDSCFSDSSFPSGLQREPFTRVALSNRS